MVIDDYVLLLNSDIPFHIPGSVPRVLINNQQVGSFQKEEYLLVSTVYL